eukprot:g17248.t1
MEMTESEELAMEKGAEEAVTMPQGKRKSQGKKEGNAEEQTGGDAEKESDPLLPDETEEHEEEAGDGGKKDEPDRAIDRGEMTHQLPLGDEEADDDDDDEEEAGEGEKKEEQKGEAK